MNHLYRIVWNAHAACWQAVSEIAKGRGKSTAKTHSTGLFDAVSGVNRAGDPRLHGLVLSVAAALLGVCAPAYAGPEGGNVVRGSASISSADKTTTINQSSDRAVINWSRFSVAADEAVRFNQPSRTSATLNRVTGGESSQIMGSLSANGHVFLLNPNGVLVGQGAQVNVGGFVASTLDIDDEDFMSGKINLKGESEAAVTNEGEITAEEGGTVVLIASEVNNTGTITANQGSVVLAGASSLTQGATTPAPAPASSAPAASTPAVATEPTPAPPAVEVAPSPAPTSTAEATTAATVAANPPAPSAATPTLIVSGGGNTADAFTVRLQDGSNIAFTIDKGAVNAMVNNGGLIKAQGGHVILTAKGRDDLSKATVNHSGVIEAQTLTTRNGVVELLADMKVGEVNLSGSINAAAVAQLPTPAPASTPSGTASAATAPAAPTLSGGFVETSAARVSVANSARVTTAGQVAAGIKTGTWLIDPNDYTIAASGGNISGATLGANLASNNVTIGTATQGTAGGNGDIFVNDPVSWSVNKLTLSAERDVIIASSLNGSQGAILGLELGGDYRILPNARVSLPSGRNLTLKYGTSSASEYLVVNNANELQALNVEGPNGRIALGSNIDVGSVIANFEPLAFNPLSSGANPAGPLALLGGYRTLDFHGLGNTISNLNISRPNEDNVGLFGFVTTGIIRDLHLEMNVLGRDNVGGLIGISGIYPTTNSGNTNMFFPVSIINTSINGTVSGRNSVGGVIGYGAGSLIDQGSFSGQIRGENSVGGVMGTALVGSKITRTRTVADVVSNQDSAGGMVGQSEAILYGFSIRPGVEISNSFVDANVSAGNDFAGGLIGRARGATVFDSYALGTVSAGNSQAGGLLGGDGYGSSISTSYAANAVNAGADAGGIGGRFHEGYYFFQYYPFPLTSSYYIGEMSSSVPVGGLNPPVVYSGYGASNTAINAAKSPAEMQSQGTFVGWDFASTWAIEEGSGLPTLRALAVAAAPPPDTDTDTDTGTGTGTPYPGSAPGGTVRPGTGAGATLPSLGVAPSGLIDAAAATDESFENRETNILSIGDIYRSMRQPFDEWLWTEMDRIEAVREQKNSNLPPTLKDMINEMKKGEGWEEVLDINKVTYHVDNIGRPEKKWVNKKTRQEAVYDGDTGQLIAEGNEAGTYNFGSNPIGHLILDILPSPQVWAYYETNGYKRIITDAGAVSGLQSLSNNLTGVLEDYYGPGGFERVFGENGFYDNLLRNKFSASLSVAKESMSPYAAVKGLFDQLIEPENWDMTSGGRLRIPRKMVVEALKEIGGNLALDAAFDSGLISKENYIFGVETLKLGFESILDPFVRIGKGEPGVGSAVDFENAFYKTKLGQWSNPNYKPLNPASNEDTYNLLDKLVKNAVEEWNRTGGAANLFSLSPGFH